MAFNNSITARYDELRSPNAPSTSTSTGTTTPSRYSGSFMQSHSQSYNDSRTNLQRRQTTDLGKMQPSITPIGQAPATQSSQTPEALDITAANFQKAKLVEKKRLELEQLQKQRKQFEATMVFMNQKEAHEKEELDRMTQDFANSGLSPGHQSEPTTPPEYRDQYASSVFSRGNRYSTSSITSPPGLNRSSRSGSQLTSPPSEIAQTLHNHINSDTLPSKSVPGSRRGSNEAIRAYVPETNGSSRRGVAGSNRYSMPVTGLRSRNHETVPEHSATTGLGQINTTSFLFGDDEDSKDSTTSPDVNNYLRTNETDDKFPILVRRNGYPGVLSASSAALDLALSQSPGPEANASNWTPQSRNRLSQQSIPQSSLNAFAQMTSESSGGEIQNSPDAINVSRNPNRHSMEASLAAYAQNVQSSQVLSGDAGRPSTLGGIHSSYSTNDVPTLKKSNGTAVNVTPPKTHADQHFHNHNASLGRIPASAINPRHSRELSGGDARREELANNFQNLNGLQASATSFSPSPTASSPVESLQSPSAQINTMQYPNQAYYPAYGMQMVNMGFTPLSVQSPMAFQSQMQTFHPQGNFGNFASFNPQNRFQGNQTHVMQQRRMPHSDDPNRFNNLRLEDMQGEILQLCKDQHGCRFLQKKLEERDPQQVQIVFVETRQHVVELMTDPFGNYLCQKLLEFANEDQRTVLINNAAPEMVKIALNSHGTRALQKMIEFVSTPEQIQTVTEALNDQVVDMIQDLNGNHVIQKCLNRLKPEDAKFIFDTVGENCVAVGTHRHGCCVLQRCIDHATGDQKVKLIDQITAKAFHLVQDPFGNYVLQYIVDLQEECFTNPLCEAFQGQIPPLSKQKFSSNVIEKCIRGAEHKVTRVMIEEMLQKDELEKMLKDSYANYVVQTAMEYADNETKGRLVEAIRPLLPAVRHTPHGRRIQSKLMSLESQGRFSGSGTPIDRSAGQIPLGLQMSSSSPMANSYAAPTYGYSTVANAFMPHQFAGNSPPYAQPASHQSTLSNTSNGFLQFSSSNNQAPVQQSAPSYGRISQVNGNFF